MARTRKRFSAAYFVQDFSLDQETRDALGVALRDVIAHLERQDLSGHEDPKTVIADLERVVSDFKNERRFMVSDDRVREDLASVGTSVKDLLGKLRSMSPKARGLAAAIAATMRLRYSVRDAERALTDLGRASAIAVNRVPKPKPGHPRDDPRRQHFAVEVARVLERHDIAVTSTPEGVLETCLRALLPAVNLQCSEDLGRLVKAVVKKIR